MNKNKGFFSRFTPSEWHINIFVILSEAKNLIKYIHTLKFFIKNEIRQTGINFYYFDICQANSSKICYNQLMKKKILGLIITVLFFVLILYKIDIKEFFNSIQLFTPKALLNIILLYTISIIFRGLRWKLFLGNSPKYNWLQLSEIFTVGTMLNIFFPARAGDIYRAYYTQDQEYQSQTSVIKIFRIETENTILATPFASNCDIHCFS